MKIYFVITDKNRCPDGQKRAPVNVLYYCVTVHSRINNDISMTVYGTSKLKTSALIYKAKYASFIQHLCYFHCIENQPSNYIIPKQIPDYIVPRASVCFVDFVGKPTWLITKVRSFKYYQIDVSGMRSILNQ